MYAKELKIGVDAVSRACELCQTVQSTLVSEETLAKRDRSPVTVADFGAQAVILHALADAFPADPVVAEEDADALRVPENEELREKVIHYVQTFLPGLPEHQILGDIDRGKHEGGPRGRFWTLDPVDGTKGFIRGEQYAIALALIEDGRVVLGVLGCPNLPMESLGDDGARGVVCSAISGQGATAQRLGGDESRDVQVSGIADPTDAAFCESVESGHTSHDDAARIAERLGVQATSVRLDSQCKYAVVARGEASVYLRLPTRADYEEKIWDHAAGSILVKEAGGEVTDVNGVPLDFSQGRTLMANSGVIATNAHLHDAVVRATGKILKPSVDED